MASGAQLQVPLPPRYTQLSPDEIALGIRAAKEQPGRRAGDPRPPLPARRSHPVRRLRRRLLPAVARTPRQRPRPSTSSSAACTSWPRPPTSSPAPHQQVILPEPGRRLLDGRHGRHRPGRGGLGASSKRRHDADDDRVIPVTYMNSSAALKAFCGEHGGIVCTSSQRRARSWSGPSSAGDKVLFFPDQHLGRNTAKAMGVPLEQMPMWNPRKPLGGQRRRTTLRGRRVILLARLLLGAQALHRRADRNGAGRVPRRPASSCTPSARCDVVDAADATARPSCIIKAIEAGAGRRDVRDRHRDQPGQPPGAGASRQDASSASTPSSAPARRCTASTPAPGLGARKAAAKAAWSTRS